MNIGEILIWGIVLRRGFSLPLRWRDLLLGLRFLYALLERLHRVNDLSKAWRFWRCVT
jgi:hypothetical protein